MKRRKRTKKNKIYELNKLNLTIEKLPIFELILEPIDQIENSKYRATFENFQVFKKRECNYKSG